MDRCSCRCCRDYYDSATMAWLIAVWLHSGLWAFHNEDLNCKQILIGAWDIADDAIERFARNEIWGARVTFVKGTVERDWKGLKTVELSGVFASGTGQVR